MIFHAFSFFFPASRRTSFVDAIKTWPARYPFEKDFFESVTVQGGGDENEIRCSWCISSNI